MKHLQVRCSVAWDNPVLKTSDDRVLAVDAKVVLDDNALFVIRSCWRWGHNEEDPFDVEAGEHNLTFVKLDAM